MKCELSLSQAHWPNYDNMKQCTVYLIYDR